MLRQVLRGPPSPSVAKPRPQPTSEPVEKPATEARIARLGNEEIPYLLKRSKQRRRIGLQVDERGLVVLVPWRSADRHIDKVLQDGDSWIRKKLASWHANAPRSRTYQSGDPLDYLGQQLILAVVQAMERPLVMLMDDHRLEVRTPHPEHTIGIKQALAKWYKRHAQSHFAGRVEHYARELNLRKLPRTIVSSATTRWGSCNADREIRLSWRLMQAPAPLIDYVVAHEVSHILEMNHSPRFWAIVEKLCPDYARARTELTALTRHYMSL